MVSQSFFSQPTIQRLPILLREVKDGGILIPRFQRPFVWSTEQRLLLLESVAAGMPIGSILVWRTRDHVLECYQRLGPAPLGASSAGSEGSQEVKQYLLDGHQRLTTLYAALGGGLVEDGAASEAEAVGPSQELDDAGNDDGWPIYYDLGAGRFVPARGRRQVASTWLPLDLLFDPYRLYELQKRLQDHRDGRQLMIRAENLASRMKDYSIPVVPMVTEDLELVTETFQRINSPGTKMDQVHMINALTWRPDFDLNERLERIREELGAEGWQELEPSVILSTCKAALQLDIYESDANAITRELSSNRQILDVARDRLLEAASFLRARCRVHGPAMLPYSFQIVLIADALGSSRGADRAAVEDRVSLWFWATTFAEFFAGMSSTRLRGALEHLRQVVEGAAEPLPDDLTRVIEPLRRFDPRSARSRALALLLADRGPLDAEGDRQPPGPHAILTEHGRHAMPTVLDARSFSVGAAKLPENRFIAHPRLVGRLRELFLDGPTLLPKAAPPRAILDSHLISAEAVSALGRHAYRDFLLCRRRDLAAMELARIKELGLEVRESRP